MPVREGASLQARWRLHGRPGPRHRAAARAAAALLLAAAAAAGCSAGPPRPAPPGPALPWRGFPYLGVYAPPAPASYAGIRSFTAATGVRPALVVYYSGWREPFQAGFAAAAVRHHAVPLVQWDPTGISLTAIAAGQYDGYLRSFAAAVRAFRAPVVLSFGHEMNGDWYSWARGHAPAEAFRQAWRHIFTVFRSAGARNVTWLWTVNVIDRQAGAVSPVPWWPGSRYVDWVGMDGYYRRPSWTFRSLFGKTIAAIRTLTVDHVLITETGVAPAAGKAAKITDVFAGARAYGLFGLIWFDASRQGDWRLDSPAAVAAYRRAARMPGARG